MKKIRFYAPMYLLVAGLAFAGPSMTAHAEEDEEVLYVETEDNYELEDVQDNSGKTAEEIAAEAAAEAAKQAELAEEAEKQKQEAERIEAEKAALEQIIGSTEIDPEDQGYNTGREEIPDSVETEAERKDIPKIPGKPDEPPQDEEPPQEEEETPQEETSQEQQEQETTEEVVTVINVTPKMGIDIKGLALTGFGGGILVTTGIGAYYNHRLENPIKVKSSRKKFRRKSKKRTKTK